MSTHHSYNYEVIIKTEDAKHEYPNIDATEDRDESAYGQRNGDSHEFTLNGPVDYCGIRGDRHPRLWKTHYLDLEAIRASIGCKSKAGDAGLRHDERVRVAARLLIIEPWTLPWPPTAKLDSSSRDSGAHPASPGVRTIRFGKRDAQVQDLLLAGCG